MKESSSQHVKKARKADQQGVVTARYQRSWGRGLQSYQHEACVSECKALVFGKPIAPKSPPIKLNPVLNEDGCIHSNGRLQFAEYLLYGVRFHKILLQISRHWVTKLIVKCYYEQANHSAGTYFVLSQISEKYWVIAAFEEMREWEGECSMWGGRSHQHRSWMLPKISTLGSPSVPLTKQQWTMLGLLPQYKEEVCTIRRGGFACLYACQLSQFIWK